MGMANSSELETMWVAIFSLVTVGSELGALAVSQGCVDTANIWGNLGNLCMDLLAALMIIIGGLKLVGMLTNGWLGELNMAMPWLDIGWQTSVTCVVRRLIYGGTGGHKDSWSMNVR
jgi:hypothetical protein